MSDTSPSSTPNSPGPAPPVTPAAPPISNPPPPTVPAQHREMTGRTFWNAMEEDLDEDVESICSLSRPGSPSPLSNLGKRTRDTDNITGDDDEDSSSTPASSVFATSQSIAPTQLNGNVLAFIKRYAARKKLRGEQQTELERFALVSHLFHIPYMPRSIDNQPTIRTMQILVRSNSMWSCTRFTMKYRGLLRVPRLTKYLRV